MKDCRHLYPKTLELDTGLSFRNQLYYTAFNLRTLAHHCNFVIDVKASQAITDKYFQMALFMERPGANHKFGRQYDAALITLFHKEWIEAAHGDTKELLECISYVNHIETGPQSDLVHGITR